MLQERRVDPRSFSLASVHTSPGHWGIWSRKSARDSHCVLTVCMWGGETGVGPLGPSVTTPRAAFKRADWLRARKSPAPGLMTRAESAESWLLQRCGRWSSALLSGFREPFPCCRCSCRRRLLSGIMVCFRLAPVPGSGFLLLCLVLGELSGPSA